MLCGMPEKKPYKPPKGTCFICSICVQGLCTKLANDEKKAAEDKKIMNKRLKRAKRYNKNK